MALFPPHIVYCEPFAGGLAVLFAKDPEGVSEVVNDIDGDVTNFWACLQNAEAFEHFRRHVEAIPFSEREFLDSLRPLTPDEFADGYGTFSTIQAARFFVRCRQSLAGRMKSFATLSRNRVRRGMNEQASAWLNAVAGLAAVHARLRRVVVLNRDAVGVIRSQDGAKTLFYLDPPYPADTRAAASVYAHEMTAADHERLLDAITDPALKGRVALSGYANPLYDARLAAWRRVDFDLPNNAAGGMAKRRMTESVWMNY